MHKSEFRTGFTLVELSISIAFIALLSIAIALITTNLVATYRKGMTLKQLNTTGTDIVNDIRSAISGSSAKGITELCKTVYAAGAERQACEDNDAYNLVNVIKKTRNGGIPAFGAFCSGTYSYIWNSGYFYDGSEKLREDDGSQSAEFRYKGGVITNFRLLKVLDKDRAVCIAASQSGSNLVKFDISGYSQLQEEPVELLDENNSLALYNLEVARPVQDDLTKNIFYAGSFVLGTLQNGIDIKANGNYCSDPGNLDYCAINKFNFAMQANGE